MQKIKSAVVSGLRGLPTEVQELVGAKVEEKTKRFVDVVSKIDLSHREEEKKKKSYSEAVTRRQEAVVIIKPVEETKATSSETTKKVIKTNIDVAKLGVGITKMKKASKGAVIIGCENKTQVEMLKSKVSDDLGEKYTVHDPKKKSVKIRIFDIDKEDCEKESELWQKIEEQNGYAKNCIKGKIVKKLINERSRRVTTIAEVDIKTRNTILEESKVKIGWNICKVQSYIGILRCYKCCGYYHFAKDCKNEACGKCAGRHATKDCKCETRKCIKCEEKIKHFGIKNLNSSHSAFDTMCPYYKRELEKQKTRMDSNL